jgi:invasion protein IalB
MTKLYLLLITCITATAAFAQQKPQPKAAPAQNQPAPPQPAAAPPAQVSAPPLTYSKWTKLCDKNAETKSRTMCRTGSDGRLDNGVPLVAAVLIEVEGEPKRVLQVTLPPGVMLPRGTRVLIDSDEQSAQVTPFIVCTNVGCVAQIESDVNGVARLKKGTMLNLQAYNMQGAVMTLSLPLAEFAKAYDGAPVDQKQLEDQNKKLIEELQKRARQQEQQMAPAKR